MIVDYESLKFPLTTLIQMREAAKRSGAHKLSLQRLDERIAKVAGGLASIIRADPELFDIANKELDNINGIRRVP